MSILGHTSPKQAAVYTKNANRRRLAGEGMAAFEAAINREQIIPLFSGAGPLDAKTSKREKFSKNGAQGRIRTTDTRIFNPLLYQLSYLGVAKVRPFGRARGDGL